MPSRQGRRASLAPRNPCTRSRAILAECKVSLGLTSLLGTKLYTEPVLTTGYYGLTVCHFHVELSYSLRCLLPWLPPTTGLRRSQGSTNTSKRRIRIITTSL